MTNRWNDILLLGLLVVLITVFLSASPAVGVYGSQEAKLGAGLGDVLLRWNLMTFSWSQDDTSESRGQLSNSLETLRSEANSSGLPSFFEDRISALLAKLEAAESEYLWSIQLGYWSFSEGNSPISFHSGAKIESLSPEVRVRSFDYLDFSDEASRVEIDVTEKSLSPPFPEFTLEFWVLPEGAGSGTLIATGGWKLVLSQGVPKLVSSSGEKSFGPSLPQGHWSHIAFVTSGNSSKLYLSGTLVGETELESKLEIGQVLTLGKGFVGKIDELRLKSAPRTREQLRYDQPIDYLIGIPVIDWARGKMSDDELWEFYAGMLTTSLRIKRERGLSSIEPDELTRVSKFLLGEEADVPEPPADLPGDTTRAITDMKKLGESGEILENDREKLGRIIENLVSYLDLG